MSLIAAVGVLLLSSTLVVVQAGAAAATGDHCNQDMYGQHFFNGTNGPDVVFDDADGYWETDLWEGNAGADTFWLQKCDFDNAIGEDGGDEMHEGPGLGTLSGGNNNDDLFGGEGTDTLEGNAGGDLIEDHEYFEGDFVQGGDDADVLDVTSLDVTDEIAAGSGSDECFYDFHTTQSHDQHVGCEQLFPSQI